MADLLASGGSLEPGFSISLITSHLILIYAIYIGIKHRFAVAAEALTSVFIASTLYHSCLAFGICPAGIPFAITKVTDHINATSLIMMEALLAVSLCPVGRGPVLREFLRLNPGVTLEDIYDDHYWSRYVFQIYLICNIFIFSTFDVNVSLFPTLASILIGLGLVGFKIFVTPPVAAERRINASLAFVGLLLQAISLAFYPLEDYFYSHNGWHWFSFLGVGIFIAAFLVYPDSYYIARESITTSGWFNWIRHARPLESKVTSLDTLVIGKKNKYKDEMPEDPRSQKKVTKPQPEASESKPVEQSKTSLRARVTSTPTPPKSGTGIEKMQKIYRMNRESQNEQQRSRMLGSSSSSSSEGESSDQEDIDENAFDSNEEDD